MKAKGFTLVELLIVITIIAVLSTIGMTVYSSAQKSARDAKRRGDLKAIANALEQYKSEHGTYTPATVWPCITSWSATFSHQTYGVSGSSVGTCLTNPPGNGEHASLTNAFGSYFSGKVPQDPLCNGTSCFSSGGDYILDVNNGNTFHVDAKLEIPPSPAMTGCAAGYNYCIYNQQ